MAALDVSDRVGISLCNPFRENMVKGNGPTSDSPFYYQHWNNYSELQ